MRSTRAPSSSTSGKRETVRTVTARTAKAASPATGCDEVLVLLRDATMDVCRRDAEQHVSDLSRLVSPRRRSEVDATVQNALARTAAFVGGRSGIVLVPDGGPRTSRSRSVGTESGCQRTLPRLRPDVNPAGS